ncbi:WEB family protein At3g02930, chloroplastic-like isoform X2 [Hibiscus syriacus]|uniref:WEB family protein At3g02930, chloroplastic-like isoform X2 n=1 Tax=Hibiscus syriacus TaxID=106335 RepID=UPI001920C743|nr:WEB family protein At3g02930, chloroplastic-like isoform X2 [Hibiscus syriacus]
MSAKSKSSSSDTPTKVSPATPRVASKVSRGLAKPEPGSPSPLQSACNSADRSQRLSLNSTPTVVRRSPKVATPPEKPQTRVGKGLELQAQLNSVQEDLKKANEKISLIEKEKAQAIDELKEAQKAAEEANDKLREALAAQKLAEENSEIEKFRTLELEQVEMDAAQKKDEEWKIEIESVRNQHALDVAALVSTTQELQRVKQELAMTCDTKNQALNHADDATKIAEIHAEKAEILSAELVRLKSLLELKREREISENNEMVLKLREEIESLKQEVEKAKAYEEKLVENEAFVEQLNVDLEAAKMAESYTRNVVDEWGNKVEKLEMQIGEAKKLERSTSESLNAVMKQLESTNDSLQDAESEIASLKEKVRSFEMTISTQRRDLEKSEHQINTAKEESAEARKLVESLKSELETVKEEKTRALDNEKLAVSRVQTLLEEKSKLFNELENSKDEEEKSKKAMESLASALHEVSAEARDAKEKLLSCETNNEKYETQLDELRLFLKETDEKYKTMLDDAKNEIDLLTNTIEQSKNEHQNSITEWEQKELHLVDCVKKSDEENSSLQKEINRLVNLLKQSEEEATASKEEEARLKDSLKEVESKVIYLQESLEEVKTESTKLKESMFDKETELQSVIQENDELRAREVASLKKVEELSKLLEEAIIKKQSEENGELTDSDKDYDLLPKVVEFSEENGHGSKDKPKSSGEHPEESKIESSPHVNDGSKDEALQADSSKVLNMNGKVVHETKEKENDSVESVDTEFKMWESCRIEKKEFSAEGEPEQEESFDEEVDSKADASEGFDQVNGSTEIVDDGGNSPSKQQQHKKKKPLLLKFGNLLKKKGSSNQK